jgi:Fe2+ transport system protein FeoA
MTLAEIEIGQQVLIHQVRGQGALRRRLLEMGLTLIRVFAFGK